jgi:crotonobetainyl-CoA:carnitine CoA-transferase CaiB-like acyl-CoA transferase
MQPSQVLAQLWADAGMPADALGDIRLTGSDPVLPSSFAVGTAAQASIAAAALAAATLHHEAGGPAQTVSVDMRHAATEFHSEHWMRVNGKPPPPVWDKIAGVYPTSDGYVRLHTNMPHHRDGVLKILGCAYDRDAVAATLSDWKAEAFEQACADAQIVGSAYRSIAEWEAHPHGQAVPTMPLVSITRIGDAPKEALAKGDRPLSGLRVLDLTRVIAGPVCGRTLAAHGADVLLVISPNLPNVGELAIDTGRGKLAAHLELRESADRHVLRGLLKNADVFVQGYRPGGLAAKGFSPEDTARIRPGVVHVSLSAYGPVGPWSGKRGFDSLVQTATGINHAEAGAAGQMAPKPLPVQALDHATGYLMAFGALAALRRRAIEGGSWHVQLSLVRTGHWLRSLGRIDGGLDCPSPAEADVAEFIQESPSDFGLLRSVRHAAILSETPARWERPSVPPGTHPARWP